ncbi:protein kinase domain protein [Ichthyophthirius multifiliis]|uniref:non-specific serine/threonine protein kinase n=1 Tax=Ichthyophthirius multifiliis TaxID=5932 RepID=G0R5V5_ICHMU|nr:protein kinase domain protein [Ichthyophthirius multifiliis]EGR27132.1 protein kinase domain protein [Ichthyophthirius multifiliis]|eukprot:XP_004024016.1 protein kinase domain protein [Ichthyophthirius multifiliis]
MAQSNQQQDYEYYTQIKLLGEGAFGKAFLVQCKSDGSYCVIKKMEMKNMTEEEKKETLREARILEALKHPNIVRFREVYKTKKGQLCIVMDYCDGGDLSNKIKEYKGKYIPENQILDWFTQICLSLKHIHDRKIIHRDLKTQNIFLMKDNFLKIGDFGIAKVLNHTRDHCKTMVGTPYYLSPEIIESKSYSFKTDIWSLGIILYELCAQKPPFDGGIKKQNSRYNIADKQQSSQDSSLSDLIDLKESEEQINLPLNNDFLEMIVQEVQSLENSQDSSSHNDLFKDNKDENQNNNNINNNNNNAKKDKHKKELDKSVDEINKKYENLSDREDDNLEIEENNKISEIKQDNKQNEYIKESQIDSLKIIIEEQIGQQNLQECISQLKVVQNQIEKDSSNIKMLQSLTKIFNCLNADIAEELGPLIIIYCNYLQVM